jgi:hypothetical protein
MKKDQNQLTKKAVLIICDACGKRKMCHMYVTQMGTTCWVCKDCREGKNK